MTSVSGRKSGHDHGGIEHGHVTSQPILLKYLSKQGPAFEIRLDAEDAVGARNMAEKMFTFSLGVIRDVQWAGAARCSSTSVTSSAMIRPKSKSFGV